MGDIWDAAKRGALGEVERLVGQNPDLLNARDARGGWYKTPLMVASEEGHVNLARWLLDKRAAINEQSKEGHTALWFASYQEHPAVVRLLVEEKADPSIATKWGSTPLLISSEKGHLEVVHLLTGHPSGKATINRRDADGRTALWRACDKGRGEVARVLLEAGADPTIADRFGITPVANARHGDLPYRVTAKGRRECVAVLEVSFCLALSLSLPLFHQHVLF
jgi:uncharacterized protein